MLRPYMGDMPNDGNYLIPLTDPILTGQIEGNTAPLQPQFFDPALGVTPEIVSETTPELHDAVVDPAENRSKKIKIDADKMHIYTIDGTRVVGKPKKPEEKKPPKPIDIVPTKVDPTKKYVLPDNAIVKPIDDSFELPIKEKGAWDVVKGIGQTIIEPFRGITDLHPIDDSIAGLYGSAGRQMLGAAAVKHSFGDMIFDSGEENISTQQMIKEYEMLRKKSQQTVAKYGYDEERKQKMGFFTRGIHTAYTGIGPGWVTASAIGVAMGGISAGVQALAGAAIGGTAGGAPTGGVGAAPGAAAGGVIGAGTGFATGYASGTLAGFYLQGVGDIMEGMAQNGIDFESAALIASMAGAPYAMIERMQMSHITKPLIMKTFSDKILKDTVLDAAKNSPFLSATIIRGLSNIGMIAVKESLEEAAQEGIKDMGSFARFVIDGDSANAGRVWDSMPKNMIDEFWEMFPAALVMGGVTGGKGMVSEYTSDQSIVARTLLTQQGIILKDAKADMDQVASKILEIANRHGFKQEQRTTPAQVVADTEAQPGTQQQIEQTPIETEQTAAETKQISTETEQTPTEVTEQRPIKEEQTQTEPETDTEIETETETETETESDVEVDEDVQYSVGKKKKKKKSKKKKKQPKEQLKETKKEPEIAISLSKRKNWTVRTGEIETTDAKGNTVNVPGMEVDLGNGLNVLLRKATDSEGKENPVNWLQTIVSVYDNDQYSDTVQDIVSDAKSLLSDPDLDNKKEQVEALRKRAVDAGFYTEGSIITYQVEKDGSPATLAEIKLLNTDEETGAFYHEMGHLLRRFFLSPRERARVEKAKAFQNEQGQFDEELFADTVKRTMLFHRDADYIVDQFASTTDKILYKYGHMVSDFLSKFTGKSFDQIVRDLGTGKIMERGIQSTIEQQRSEGAKDPLSAPTFEATKKGKNQPRQITEGDADLDIIPEKRSGERHSVELRPTKYPTFTKVGLPEMVDIAKTMLGDNPIIMDYLGNPGTSGYFKLDKKNPHIALLRDRFIGDRIAIYQDKRMFYPDTRDDTLKQLAKEHDVSVNDLVLKHYKTGNKVYSVVILRDHDAVAQTLAHEIGHADSFLPQRSMDFDNLLTHIVKVVGEMRDQIAEDFGITDEEMGDIKTELIELSKMWRGDFDETDTQDVFNAYRSLVPELYADAMSVLFNNPELLKQVAPKFTDRLGQFFEAHQPLVEKYNAVIDSMMEGSTDQMRLDRQLAMYTHASETIDLGIQRRLSEEARRKSADKFKLLWHDFADRSILLHSDEARKAYSDISYIPTDVMTVYHYHIATDIMNPLLESDIGIEYVGAYMHNRRAAGERADMANPLGIRGEDALGVLNGIRERLGDEKYKLLEESVDKFWELRKKYIIPHLKGSNLFTAELMKKIISNKEYATFNVVKFLEEGSAGQGIPTAIKRQRGTLDDITNPFLATMQKDSLLLFAAVTNKAKIAMVDAMLESDPGGIKEIKRRGPNIEIPADTKKFVYYYREGILNGAIVRPEIASMFKNDSMPMNIMYQGMSAATSIIKGIYTTYNPGFGFWNLIRDARSTYMNVPTKASTMKERGVEASTIKRLGMEALDSITLPFKMGKSYLSTIRDAYKYAFKGELSDIMEELLLKGLVPAERMWKARDDTSLSEYDRQMMEFDLKMLDPKHTENMFIRGIKSIFKDYNQMMETWSKLAGYKLLESEQVQDVHDVREIMRSAIGTPDIHTSGKYSHWTNMIFLYSNINVQGYTSAMRAMKRNPTSYLMRLTTMAVIPALIKAYLQFGDDDDGDEDIKDYRDAFRAIPEYEKSGRLAFPVAWDGKTVSWIPMPMDFVGETVNAIIWHAFASKDATAQKILDVMFDALPMEPGSLNPLLGIGRGALQYIRGQNPYDYFRGQPIIDETIWRAGGFDSAKEYAKWTWNQILGTAVGGFEQPYSMREKGVQDLPVIKPVMRRFIRTAEKKDEPDYAQERHQAVRLKSAKDFAADFIRNNDNPRAVIAYKEWRKENPDLAKGYRKSAFTGVFNRLLERSGKGTAQPVRSRRSRSVRGRRS
jgi:hypothetical protein